ncbi:MAG TPA: biopolymer transporter ExbD [Chitinophagaceae bacterium]|nr:biopolymer transporter ExbD [Chitinophagaceae bacterium]
MTQLENAPLLRPGKSFSQPRKKLLRIDMTPMVDLGFLLITFFVFTTTSSNPRVTDLYMPKNSSITNQLPESLALTLLLDDNDKIYYYHGDFTDAIKTNRIFETGYSITSGLGKIIRKNKKTLMPVENLRMGGVD